ncbi:PE domain-containing protein [Nocardia paucivorans]|uniref:PE domain-containing protein n=1 Tax=Nocardia paucivorans TaxID=114259 RepID=UPI000303A178|nr:PE domain-containing protein [Nocardia paucivorans]
MEFEPSLARKSATALDALAARLESDLQQQLPALAVEPAAQDEVSVRAAESLRDVASSYGDAATAGVLEIRKLAAALRSHTDVLTRMDEDNADGLRAVI